MKTTFLQILPLLVIPLAISCQSASSHSEIPDRHRVIISTDIGGTDPDDFQSMVHLLLYADVLDIEGLISSPHGPGRKEHILEVLEYYEEDYSNLVTYSSKYPTTDSLRQITKQGAIEIPDISGLGEPTEGSEWIIQCARRDNPRPLHILVWGGLEDLAQALHDAPDILPKLRVYFIGGPNKKWSVNAYNYIEKNHKELWIIESNATYRGWFVGGNQSGEFGNTEFVAQHIAGHGALGDFFATQLHGTIKMGDSPTVTWLLHGNPENPNEPGWGGRYVRAWERPYKKFNRITSESDSIAHFGVLELHIPFYTEPNEDTYACMEVENQQLQGSINSDYQFVFLFSPRDAKIFNYKIISNIPEIDGQTGRITSYPTQENKKLKPSSDIPNWWTDDPSPEVSERNHIGAKTVNKWREEFLLDFAIRIRRCKEPKISIN